MLFIIPEETRMITRCLQFHCVNVHHKFDVTLSTKTFEVEHKQFIVKSCNYISVNGFRYIKSVTVKF